MASDSGSDPKDEKHAAANAVAEQKAAEKLASDAKSFTNKNPGQSFGPAMGSRSGSSQASSLNVTANPSLNSTPPPDRNAQKPKAKKGTVIKRRFPRRKFTQKIGLLFKGKYSVTESVQIGEGGMMILSPHKHVEGDQVVISFLVPGRAFVIVRAQVQYKIDDTKAGKIYYGMKFLNITFDHRRKLRDFIAAKSEKEAVQEGVYNMVSNHDPGSRKS